MLVVITVHSDYNCYPIVHLVSPFANFFNFVFPSSRPNLAATPRAKETLELPENILMLGIIAGRAAVKKE